MSSQERKEKRQRQQRREGVAAIARVQVLEVEANQHKKLLSTAMDQLLELQDKYNELELSWGEAHGKAFTLEGRNSVLERDNEQLTEANTALRSQVRSSIEDARNQNQEIHDLKMADKDSGKLRRRLEKRATELEKVQGELSKARRAIAEA